MPYAQTNVQLYNQLRAANWADEDLRHVQSAYRLAMRVVAGHYRANEKPFVAHLVGVASILASCGAPPTVVSAGLLHAVYRHGEFGDGSRGASEDKRREVRRAVGAACEELVARYAACRWSLEMLQDLLARAPGFSPIEAAVALMKLADTLEDFDDRGHEYAPVETPPEPPAAERQRLELSARLAAALGCNRLSAELAQLGPEVVPTVPAFLQTDHPDSFAVAPMSHGMRTTVRLGMLYRLMRDGVRHARQLGRKAA
jgi:(p)ppGpp synthase/HD superfamily hydrolase